MKKTIQVILLIAIPFMITQIQSCAQAEPSQDWISVSGNKFVNESGETLVFRGVNIRDPHNLEEEGHWTKAHFQEAKDWGANVIRLPIHPRAGERAARRIICCSTRQWTGPMNWVST